jgi:hypothetical protein
MSWETDGPCRHKRQRPNMDDKLFWDGCADGEWIINGKQPSFIVAANERRSTSESTGGYQLRARVGRVTSRFTQSEACGYEKNFHELVQDEDDEHSNNGDESNEHGQTADGADDISSHPPADDDGGAESGSDCSSYQDESEESSCNEYHPNERDDVGVDEDDDGDIISDSDIDEPIDVPNDFSLEIDRILNSNPDEPIE